MIDNLLSNRHSARSERSNPDFQLQSRSLARPIGLFDGDRELDSDSDNIEEEGRHNGEYEYAQGYGRGPLDSDDLSTDSSQSEEDDGNVSLFINDGTSLRYIRVARHLVLEPQREQEEDFDADQAVLDQSISEAMRQVEHLVLERGARWAAQDHQVMAPRSSVSEAYAERQREMQRHGQGRAAMLRWLRDSLRNEEAEGEEETLERDAGDQE